MSNTKKNGLVIKKKNAKVEIFARKEDRDIFIKYEQNEKKEFYINNIKINKLSDILGNIYCVLFVPEDISILKNEPSKRRRFLNIMISQLRPAYAYILSQYNIALVQRNNVLKQKKIEIIDIWDETISSLGTKIYNYRMEFIEKINKKIEKIHYEATNEKIQLKYKSNTNNYLNKLKESRKVDFIKGYTSVGIHRDDFEISLNEKPVNIYGSQGQKRSVILSLKLAELEVIYDEIEEYPILLLDDFMSELDKNRINSFLQNIKNKQVIVTCTEKFNMPNINYNTYKIENATIKKEVE